MLLSDKHVVMERLRALVLQAGGVGPASRVLRIEESTLKNRLTPTNQDHHLRLFDFFTLLDHADQEGQNLAPVLEFLSLRYGFLLIPTPKAEVEGDALHEHMSRIAKEVGELAAKVIAITSPASAGGRDLTAEELASLEKEANQAETAIAELVAVARKAVESNAIPFRPRGA